MEMGNEYLISIYRGKSVMRSFPKAMELPATSAHGCTCISGQKNGIRGE